MRTTTALGQLLKRLCLNTQWNYAVFWKLKQQEKMILTWEDGYLDDAKVKVKLENSFCDESFHFNPGMISFSDPKDAQARSCASHPLKVALANMKYHHYSLGEGFVGKVALTEGHYWIFSGELKAKIQAESFKDWHLQLAAEIKTIVLVPVAIYGVVQLGSSEMVGEDLELVLHIKDLFCTLYHDSETHGFVSSLPTNVTPLANTSHASCQPQQLPTIDPNILSILMVDHSSPSSQNYMDQIFDTDMILGADETAFTAKYDLGSASTEGPDFLNHSHIISEGNIFEYSFAEENRGINAQTDPSDCKLHSFPIESELHKALGIALEEFNDVFLNTTLPKDERPISSVTTLQRSEYHDHAFDEANVWLTREGDADLLNVVVNNLHYVSDDDALQEKLWKAVSGNFSDKLLDSSLGEGKNESTAVDLENLIPTSQQMCSSLIKAEGFINSPTSSCRSICMSTNEDNNINMTKRNNSRKLPLKNKKGDRNGSNHKPRPRDRQLIQDRVKELRELIPNGSKCSIDTLLDRTVSHMLFLQSISSQAEKLKLNEHSEVKSEVQNNVRQQDQANGASMASEQSCQPGIWPIVVEYLKQPGQILVEVLCDDYGLFLEIAHIIRRLELTILKGVLESRSDKLWAHFVLEVSRGFHRMHILWPLMQLLQRNYAPAPTKF